MRFDTRASIETTIAKGTFKSTVIIAPTFRSHTGVFVADCYDERVARKSRDQSDPSLRDKLLDTAEKLYAEQGFGSVSLRQICVAAGARNNFAVQYHFGDLEQLTAAIVTKRTHQYELERGERLAKAARTGKISVRTILEILNEPVLQLVDADGQPLGAKFMVALLNTHWGWKPMSAQMERSPITQQLIRTLEDLLPQVAPSVIWQRLYLTTIMIMMCAAQIPDDASVETRAAIIDNVLSMATVALNAPLSDENASLMTAMHL